jgi:CelD/BcsL family acetyltransferase involved in cellulose biosynthesis
MPASASADFASAVEVRVVNPLEDPVWDHWVAGHPFAGPFHGSAWARVLAGTYGHRPCHLALLTRGRPLALLPMMEVDSPLTGRRGVGLPFADVCEPLFFESVDPRLVVDVLARIGLSGAWQHVELRGATGLPAAATPSVTFCAHELDLRPGWERVVAGFDPAVRRALRKAEREEVTVEVRSERDAVRAFCRLHARTRRRHGLPPQPDRFFEAIRTVFLEPGHGALVLASHHGTPVAAAIYLMAGSRALYKFGASDVRAQSARANNLVMARGIEWLIARGAESLHFGRTSCSQVGLRRFKRSWGAVESSLAYHRLDLPSASWSRSQDRAAGRHTAVFSRLPIALNRLLGAALYPHLD